MLYQLHFSTQTAGCAPDTGRVSSQLWQIFILFIAIILTNVSLAETNSVSMSQSSSVQEIEAAIQRNGSARVIVGLNVDFKPEGELAPHEILEQQSRIATAQAQLINQIREFVALEEKLFSTVPYISLDINQIVLNLLTVNPLVKTIQLDETISLSVPNNNMEVVQ